MPGFALSVIKDDYVVLSSGFGYSDVANKVKFTDSTSHTIASISKTFIAVSIMKLVDEGKISLDQPINEILPYKVENPHFPNIPITIKHLVTHSSTINDDFDDGEKRASWLVDSVPFIDENLPNDIKEDIYYYDGVQSSISEFIYSICVPEGQWYQKSNFDENVPGEVYEYSNTGATIAALIVEIVSGIDFYQFTKEHILQPLGMNQTSWFYNNSDILYSKLYVSHGDSIYEFPRYHEASYPDGQLKSSIIDLSKFLKEMMNGYNGNGTLLSEESFDQMFSSQLQRSAFDSPSQRPLNDEYDVGVFWGISKPGYRLHSGGMIGVYSILYFNPMSNIGAITFSNLAHSEFGEIIDALQQYEMAIR